MNIPSDVCRTIRSYEGVIVTSEEHLGSILNEIAWKHKDDGWGLSEKPGGKHVVAPDGTPIAEDILHKMPENVLFDIFHGIDVGLAIRPNCGGDIGPPLSADRKFKKPINPGNTIPDPEVPPMPNPPITDCKCNYTQCPDWTGKFAELISAVDRVGARIDAVGSKVESLRNRVDELAVHSDKVAVEQAAGVVEAITSWLKSNSIRARLW